MILAFDGKDEPMRKLVKELGTGNTSGVHLPRLGTLFLDRGYAVTIIGYETWFPHRFFAAPPGPDVKEIRRWARRDPRTKYSRQLLEFLDKGGTLEVRPVKVADIRAALASGRPPIIDFDSALLCGKREWSASHVSVVTSLDRLNVTINDPSFRYGGMRTYAMEQLLYCCHRNGGSIVRVEPRR